MADGTVGQGQQLTAEVRTKQLHAEVVIKLRADKVAQAMEAAKTDGADNVFFRVGKDTYVASSSHMSLRGISRGDLISFNGQTATITQIDSELNTGGEGWRASSNTGYVLGAVTGLAAGTKQAVYQLTHPYELTSGRYPTQYYNQEGLKHIVSAAYAEKLGTGKILGRAGITGLLVAGLAYGLTKVGGAVYGWIEGATGPDLEKLRAYAE